MHDYAGRGIEIEVAAHQDAAFRRARREGGAAVIRRHGFPGPGVIVAPGQELHDVPGQFAGAASAAFLNQGGEAVVAPEFQEIQAVVQFLDGFRALEQRAELRPRADPEQEYQGEQAPQDDSDDLFHGYLTSLLADRYSCKALT